MGKPVIIVESPNKVSHIQEFVGSKYKVMASVGHIRKIADTGKNKIGVDYDNGFTADYVIDEKKKDVVKNLKAAVKDADLVVLATDDDAEGEAIAWHLKEVLKVKNNKLVRCVFKEITKKSVLEGLNNPRKINEAKADAALARAKFDKIMGYLLSQVVRSKVGGVSAGRVQSVALKLVCEREREIRDFNVKEYFEIFLPVSKNNAKLTAQFIGTSRKKFTSVESEAEVKDIISKCKKGNYFVHNIEKKERIVKPKPAFTTSTMLQECSTKLGYSTDKITEHAQSLFAKGLITYIRTDSTRMSDEFIAEAKKFIVKEYGENYYSGYKVTKGKGNVQDAHEAIRTTNLENTPELVRDSGVVTPQEYRVYKLIYNRSIAAVMADSKVLDTNVTIANDDYRFMLKGHEIVFDGFRVLYDIDEEDIGTIESFKLKEKINDGDLIPQLKKTNPPSRYTEVSLIKKLEDLKIGRPSTYASIIKIITDTKRGYTKVDGKTVSPVEKGENVDKFLGLRFNPVINYTYTAEFEDKLEAVERGEITALQFLTEAYGALKPLLAEARKSESMKPKPVETDRKCPKCGKMLVKRKGTYGEFFACSGFPKCRYTEKADSAPLDTSKLVKCPSCGIGYMVERKSKPKTKKDKVNIFYGCNRFPDCKTAMTVEEFLKRKKELNNPDWEGGDKS